MMKHYDQDILDAIMGQLEDEYPDMAWADIRNLAKQQYDLMFTDNEE